MPRLPRRPLMCFDLDGTLIDSTDAHIESHRVACRKNNLKFPGKKRFIKNFGPGIETTIKQIFPKISSRKLEKYIADHIEAHKKSCRLIKPFPHVKEALLKLKKHFEIAVVSNSHHDEVLELLECAGVPIKIFDVIIGEDDARAKPSPTEILLAEKLTRKNAKYMVGDTIYDIKAGKRAKCKTIGVLTGVHDFETLMTAKPDVLASSVAILPDILLNK